MRSRKNTQKKTKKKTKPTKWIIISIIVIIAGYYFYNSTKPKPSSYESVTAETGNITKYYSFFGNVESKKYQTVKAEKIMQISEILVKNGDTVATDDILLKTTTEDEIKAPMDGKINGLDLDVNTQILAGAELLDIYDYNNLQITVKVYEYDLSTIEVGKEVKVNINPLDKEFTGTINSISDIGTVVNDVTYFSVVIDVVNDDTVKIGMSAEIKLESASVENAIILPMKSIQFNDDNTPYVLLKGEKDEPVKTEITTGINDGTNIEIISGVRSGDTVFYSKGNTT